MINVKKYGGGVKVEEFLSQEVPLSFESVVGYRSTVHEKNSCEKIINRHRQRKGQIKI
jgi:hypothetical protein